VDSKRREADFTTQAPVRLTPKERWSGSLPTEWRKAIRLWVSQFDDCQRLGGIEPYSNCRVAGVVHRLVIDPSGGVVEVLLTDGVDWCRARWPIAHLGGQLRAAPGSGLIIRGIIRPDGAVPVMEDPSFEIVPGPRDG
jgi:hypothetical protein